MKVKIYLVCLLGYLGLTEVHAQQAMSEVLTAISRNNKTLAAQRQYLEAQKKLSRTGLNPANPVIDYDYLKGSPAEAGNQTDLSLTQSLDFPTVYARKRALATEQARYAEAELAVNRQQILLDAQLISLALIYHHRINLQLAKRVRQTEKLVTDYQKQLQQGNIGILEVNKAKLQLIQIRQKQRMLAAAQQQLSQKLTELNGGQPLSVKDTLPGSAHAAPL